MQDIFPDGIPHNGALKANSTDSLLRVWASISRRETQTVDARNIITGVKGSGDWVQVGRNALPLFNAGLVGTQRQTRYLHSRRCRTSARTSAPTSCSRCWCAMPMRSGSTRRSAFRRRRWPAQRARGDIINAINLGRPIPVADGFTGDVITLDAAIDSSFPNGRRMGGGTAPNRNQVNVNSVLISLIVAGDPAAGLAQGRRSQRQELPRSIPVPGARTSGAAAGSRRHQRAHGPEHSRSRQPVTPRGHRSRQGRLSRPCPTERGHQVPNRVRRTSRSDARHRTDATGEDGRAARRVLPSQPSALSVRMPLPGP